jgi:hypothetical protein
MLSVWLDRARSSWRAMVRAAVLVAVGALVVGPAVAPGGGVSVADAAATARWTSCPGVGFYPLFSDSYDPSSVYGTNQQHGRFSHGVLSCELQLPSGATITAVEFHLFDGYPSADIGPCSLTRMKLDPPTGATQMLAGPRSTSGTPGYVTLTDTSIAYATVDNRYRAYYATCAMQALSSDLGILGVSVRYTP